MTSPSGAKREVIERLLGWCQRIRAELNAELEAGPYGPGHHSRKTYEAVRDLRDRTAPVFADLWLQIPRPALDYPSESYADAVGFLELVVGRCRAELRPDSSAGESSPKEAARNKQRCPRGQAPEWILDYVVQYHEYDGESVSNWEPLAVGDIVAGLDHRVSRSAVSRWFQTQFGGHAAYVAACGRRANGPLLSTLRRFRGEGTTVFIDPDEFTAD